MYCFNTIYNTFPFSFSCSSNVFKAFLFNSSCRDFSTSRSINTTDIVNTTSGNSGNFDNSGSGAKNIYYFTDFKAEKYKIK